MEGGDGSGPGAGDDFDGVDGVEWDLSGPDRFGGAQEAVPAGGGAGLFSAALPEGVLAGRMRVPVCANPPEFAGYCCAGAIESVLAVGQTLGRGGGRVLTLRLGCDAASDESVYLQAAREMLQAVRFESQRTGVAVAVECGFGSSVTSIGEFARIIDDAAAWSVGACVRIDLGLELAPQLGSLQRLAGRVHEVRVVSARKKTTSGGDEVAARLRHLAAAMNAAGFARVVVLPSALAARAGVLRGRERG